MSDNTIPAPGGVSPVVLGRVAPSDPAVGSGHFSIYPQVPTRHGAHWSLADIVLLRRAWADLAIERDTLPGLLGRTINAIEHMVNILALGPRPTVSGQPNQWSAEHDVILREKWHTSSRGEIAALVERSPNAVSLRARALKLGPSDFMQRAREQRLADARAKLEARRQAKEIEAVATQAQRRTVERRDFLMDAWPGGVSVDDIIADMRSLPGSGPIDPTFVRNWARDLGLSRPNGFTGKRSTENPIALWEKPAPVVAISRSCLCCRASFVAESRFLRLCQRCRHQSEGLV